MVKVAAAERLDDWSASATPHGCPIHPPRHAFASGSRVGAILGRMFNQIGRLALDYRKVWPVIDAVSAAITGALVGAAIDVKDLHRDAFFGTTAQVLGALL